MIKLNRKPENKGTFGCGTHGSALQGTEPGGAGCRMDQKGQMNDHQHICNAPDTLLGVRAPKINKK